MSDNPSWISELLPEASSFFTLASVHAFEGIPAALLKLRRKSGQTQEQLAAKAGLDAAMLSRYERGAHLPALPTLDEILRALGASVADLAATLDEVNGRVPVASAGKARMRWVSGLTLRPRFDAETLAGFLHGLDPQDEQERADFVASVEYAARGLAGAALQRFDEERAKVNLLQFRGAPGNEEE